MKRTHGSREKDHRISSMSKNKHFYIPEEVGRVPLKIFFFHIFGLMVNKNSGLLGISKKIK
jgi:hypothetical protein